MAGKAPYSRSVFINCPFDEKYVPLFKAIVFAILDAGFVARTSLEFDDGTCIRIAQLIELIKECQYGIHDLSRIQLNRGTKLPRFNMPLELGMFLAAKAFGSGRQKQKVCLILDTERYRYQSFISDIAGQDPHAHKDDPKLAIRAVRTWLATNSRNTGIPGVEAIWKRYQRFVRKLPDTLRQIKLKENEITFLEYTQIIRQWLVMNP